MSTAHEPDASTSLDGLHTLQTGGRRLALGVPAATPRLSWKVGAGSGLGPATLHTVVVAADAAALDAGTAIWQTTTDRPFVEYAGPALGSRTRRAWRVIATDGATTVISPVATFETGLTAADDWQANWIRGVADPFRHESFDPAPYLRHEFELGDDAEAALANGAPARLYASALGLYRLWINGVEITADSHFRPGWSDYRTRVFHQTYDIRAALRPSRNVIAAIIAKGWYAGRLGLLRKPGFYGDRPALLAQLEVDGAVVATTDGSWRSTAGAITGTDMLRGEWQDLRREPHGWHDAGFDDRAWQPVEPIDPPAAAIDPQPHDSICTHAVLAGQLVHEHARGPLVFDFGQNIVGWTRLTSPMDDAVEVIVRHGEVLTPEQLVYRDNLRGAFQEDRYVAGPGHAPDAPGDTPLTVEPRFTSHGFRYAEVWNVPSTTEYGQFKRRDDTTIEAIAVTGLPQVTGRFTCSNAALTQLASNIEWTVRDNVLEAMLDCPQRDERHGWLGDAGAIVATAAYHFDMSAFLVKFTQDAADGQGPDGEIPNYVPVVPPSGIGPGAPGWADGYIRLVHLLVERYGELATARRLFPSMRAFLDHVDRHNPDGLRVNAVGANFGDWLSLPAQPDAPFHKGFEYTHAYSTTPHDIHGTAHTYRSFAQLAEIATRLGDTDEAARLRRRADDIRAAYLDAFVEADGSIRNATQAAYAQALGVGIFEGAEAQVAADRLRAAIEQVGHVTTGIHGTQYVLSVLADHGHGDFANELLLRDSMPSWLYMVSKGATTIWEKWNGIAPDGTLATAEMNSFNHYALGAIGRYIFERVGGIDAADTTWSGEIVMRPNYTRSLDWVDCSYASPVGEIASSWRWDGSRVEHDVAVPGAATARFVAPVGTRVAADRDRDPDGDGAVEALTLGPGRHRLLITGASR